MNEEDEISAINSPDSRRGNISDQRRSKSAGCDDEDDQPPGLANAGRESAVEFGYVRGTGGRPVRPTRSPDRETSPVPPKAQFGRRLSLDADDGILVSSGVLSLHLLSCLNSSASSSCIIWSLTPDFLLSHQLFCAIPGYHH